MRFEAMDNAATSIYITPELYKILVSVGDRIRIYKIFQQ